MPVVCATAQKLAKLDASNRRQVSRERQGQRERSGPKRFMVTDSQRIPGTVVVQVFPTLDFHSPLARKLYQYENLSGNSGLARVGVIFYIGADYLDAVVDLLEMEGYSMVSEE